jgi:hypothetical protein
MIKLPSYGSGEEQQQQQVASSSAISLNHGQRLPPYAKIDIDDITPPQVRFHD